jgi:hypothetical protein
LDLIGSNKPFKMAHAQRHASASRMARAKHLAFPVPVFWIVYDLTELGTLLNMAILS